jgi:hypothetical protein
MGYTAMCPPARVENQFLWWEQTEHDANKFVTPEVVIESLNARIP